MAPLTVRKTFNYKLRPTAEQEGTLAVVLWRCCERYHAALQERQQAWQKCAVSSTAAGQSAQLPEIHKAVRPAYRAIHSQVLQDVLTRVERPFPAFFRRVKAGETPGYARCKRSTRYGSFTDQQFGNGATLDNGFLVLAQRGRLAVRWSRLLEGTPKTVPRSRAADGWYACISCAAVPIASLPLTGGTTGIDVGRQVFLVRAETASPSRIPGTADARNGRSGGPSAGSAVARRGARVAARPSPCSSGGSSRSSASGVPASTRRRSPWCASTT